MCFPPRESQTRIKHKILHAYAGAWIGIITQGMKRYRAGGGPGGLHFAYLDAFAGAGCYDGEADGSSRERQWGSPIIAMRVLELEKSLNEREVPIDLTGIAIERDHCAELIASLNDAQLRTPINPASSFDRRLGRGKLTVIDDDTRKHVESVVDTLDSNAFLLALLDPYGPSLPLSMACKVVSRPKTDCIIFFPTSEVMRKETTALKGDAQLGSNDLSNLTRLDNLFGGPDGWRAIATDTSLSAEERRQKYVELYRTLISRAIPDGVVKEIGLRFSSTENPGYHLILTTRDADGALKMNEILRKAGFREHWELWQDWEAKLKSRSEDRFGLELDFGLPHRPAPSVTLEKPAAEEIDVLVYGAVPFLGSIRFKQLLNALANTLATRQEIVSSLKRLVKRQAIDWDGSTAKNAEIKWLT